jgi:hypothetical protein
MGVLLKSYREVRDHHYTGKKVLELNGFVASVGYSHQPISEWNLRVGVPFRRGELGGRTMFYITLPAIEHWSVDYRARRTKILNIADAWLKLAAEGRLYSEVWEVER